MEESKKEETQYVLCQDEVPTDHNTNLNEETLGQDSKAFLLSLIKQVTPTPERWSTPSQSFNLSLQICNCENSLLISD